MDTKAAVRSLAALAQDSRLEVFRLLVQAGPEGLAAGEIADRLGIPGSTLSFHIKALSHAGLAESRQEGRFVYYSANFSAMNALIAFLGENCCNGRACLPQGNAGPKETRTMNRHGIRPATPDDFSAILALLDEASLPTQDLGNARPVHFWVAERDGRIEGAGGLEQYSDAGLLRSLVVTHAARGTGLGIALVETLEHAAATMGISRLVLLTRTARSFFEHRGYSVIPRESAPDAVRTSAEFRVFSPAPAVCMTKSIARTVQPALETP